MYYGYTNFNLNRRMSQKRGAIETVIHWIGFTLKPEYPVSEKEVMQLLGMTGGNGTRKNCKRQDIRQL